MCRRSHTFERKHTDAVIDVCIVNHLLEGFEVSYVLSASSDRSVSAMQQPFHSRLKRSSTRMRAIVILRRRLIRAWSLRAEQLRCVSKLRAHTAPVCVLLCAEKSGLLISASDDARWIVRTRGRAGAVRRVTTTTTYCELQRRVLEAGRCACGVLGRNGRSPLAQKEHTPRSS